MGADAGQAAALLARSVLAQGRIDEADRYADQSERIAGHNLQTAIAWRAVRGEILSAQGEHAAAMAKAREAVAVAAETDLVLDHADACLALSRVLAAAGDAAAAARARSDAESLYAAKDAVFLVSRTTESAAPKSISFSSKPAGKASRLSLTNRVSEVLELGLRALQESDPEGPAVVAVYSDRVVYEDRRPLSGDPIAGNIEFRSAAERKHDQYPHVEWLPQAVRGESLVLVRAHWWDDAGNATTSLDVFELGDDDLIDYHGRFDEDDFDSAYRELETRYYASEGAPFAENGRAVGAWVDAVARRDVEAARRVSWPDFRWLASPSSLKPEKRTVDEFFHWLDERAQQLSAMRSWPATIRWLSPDCFVLLNEIQGSGVDGDQYLWEWIHVGEYRDGLAVSVREFDIDDEDAAFAYAESLVSPRQQRLVVANAASRAVDRAIKGLQANDADAVNGLFSARIVYEDRRPFAGALVTGVEYVSDTIPALLAQFDQFTGHALAVRGDRVCLAWSRWSDETGNESSNLHVIELGDDGLIVRYLYFADDDFAGAYRAMEAWYYAGEGAAYANPGHTQSAFVAAMDNLDVTAARQLCRPEFQWSSPTRALADPERTIDEVVSWWRDRAEQVDSLRNWTSAITWITPEVAVSVGEARGLSRDGADYSWSGIFVAAFREGLLQSIYGFEPEDEDAAFTYAESLVKQRNSRLVAANAASWALEQAFAALQANDPSAVATLFSSAVVYEDRRPLAGALQTGADYLNEVVPALLHQYGHFELRILAVRGGRVCLAWSRWSDESGNEATNLHVTELGEDGLIARLLSFVEDDFWNAYRAMETSHFNGEGLPYAQSGRASADWVIAISNGDIEGVRRASHPDFRWYATPSALKDAERTVDDMFRWWGERGRQVASQRHWVPALVWLSPDCAVGRGEIAAVGPDGEQYNWNFIYVAECRDGLLLAVREFEDEDSAFAYAEEHLRAATSRLAVSNQASDAGEALGAAMNSLDADCVVERFSDEFIYDDRRRFSGGSIADLAELRAATERIFSQYNYFESRLVAVRGERLSLTWTRWSDDAGNESRYLVVIEAGDDGLIQYQARFDEDDFENAYIELEERYYAGEGGQFACAGATLTDFVKTLNRGDLDKAFSMFGGSARQIESRSRSIFPDRTSSELRTQIEELMSMVSSVRWWYSALCWLSPTCAVARQEREATGPDGEKFAWTHLYAGEFGREEVRWVCEFEVGDEDAAFAYAEERMRAVASGRLAVANQATDTGSGLIAALHAGDVDAAADFYSDQVSYDDRRRLSGDPVVGTSAVRHALERIAAQYSMFEAHTLAVRGECLQLARCRWSDGAGNQSTGLVLTQIGEDGLILYDGRFDEEDFDSRLSRTRGSRYYAGEACEYAEQGACLPNSSRRWTPRCRSRAACLPA